MERKDSMITESDILNFNVYKKEVHTGSDRGMRFQIGLEEEKIEETDENGETVTKSNKVLAVYVWPEPFAFDKTKEDKKLRKVFDFSTDGQKQALHWLNKIREEYKEYWDAHEKTMVELSIPGGPLEAISK